MAVMSFVIQCDGEHVSSVMGELEKIPNLDLHGVHNGFQIVAVTEMASEKMEDFLADVKKINYVQTCEVSYINVEDEI